MELGGFHAGNTGLSSFLLQDLTSSPEVTRLDTALARDFLGSRTTLRIGDTISTGGALSAPVRMAGIQYATNFGTDPTFVTFPLPTIGGLARQDSVVDVFIDNVQRDTRSVPPGPFSLESLPVVTGAGEVQLVVTDLLGREQLITQSYYVSSRLLKPGLQDFGYELGATRRDYGRESFDYGDALRERHPPLRLQRPPHRRGACRRRAVDQQTAALGGSWLLGDWGVVSGGTGLGHSDDGGPGWLGQFAYEYDARSFSFGARTRYTTDGYREAGADEADARIDQVSFSLDFGDFGRLGTLFLNREGRDTENATTIAATYSIALGPGSLTLRAAQLFRARRRAGGDGRLHRSAWASAARPACRRSSAAATTERAATFRQTRGASDLGLDYRHRRGDRHARRQHRGPRRATSRRSEPPISRRSGSTATTRCGPA